MAKSRQTGDLVSDSNIFVDIANDRVGIGTTNPTTKLQVYDGSLNVYRPTGEVNLQVESGDTSVAVFRAISPYRNWRFGIQGGANADFVIRDATSSANRLGITSAGEVIIGSNATPLVPTGTASQPLQVTGGAYVSGSVGIGTTSPLQKLHVLGNLLVAAGSSTGQHITQKAYELNNGTLSWEGSAGQLFSITNNLTSGSIFSVNDVSGIPSFDVNADGTVTLAPYADGNVGIATTRPTSRLHVIGNTLITGIATVNSNFVVNGNTLYADATNNRVGIGTTNPQTLLQVGAASTQSVFVTSTGRVGVGTTNPAYKMEIWGDGTVGTTGENLVRVLTTSSTGYGSRIILNSTNITGGRSYHIVAAGSLDEAAAGSFIIKDSVSDVARLVINSSGNLGIGTTNPNDLLHLSTSGSAYIRAERTASGSEGAVIIGASSLGNELYSRSTGTTAKDFRFVIGTAEALRINTSGSVGIGTTNPTAKLEPVDTAANPSVAPVVFIQRPNNVAPASIAPTNADLRIKSHSSNVKIYAEDHSANPLMILTGNGNFGIGTTNPQQKLDVRNGTILVVNPDASGLRVLSGAATSYASMTIGRTVGDASISVAGGAGQWASNSSSGDLVIRTETTSTKLLFTNGANNATLAVANNNVGIGTTNPSTKLEIVNTANDASLVEVTRFTASNSTGSTNFRVLSGHSNVDTSLRRVQLDTLRGDTNFAPITITQTNSNGTSERVRIDSSGNVGIGTTNPTSRLHVFGSATTAPIKIGSATTLTTPEQGAIEYDGTVFYKTPNTVSGRGISPSTQVYRVLSDGTAFGPGLSDVFPANSNLILPANSVYEFEFNIWALKTTLGVVTFSLVPSVTVTNYNFVVIQSGTGGIEGALSPAQMTGIGASTVTTTLSGSATNMSAGSMHQLNVKGIIEMGAGAGNLRIKAVQSAGTLTTKRGSYMKFTQLPLVQVGIFTA